MEKTVRTKVFIIIVALLLSAIIYLATRRRSSGIEAYKGQTVYIKCSNPNCGYTQEMDKAKYFQIIHDKYGDEEKPFVCPECGSKCYRAMKCPKCGEIFIRGSIQGDFVDRCPKCGYSALEQDRN